MSGIYNVNSISINGNVINGVDVSQLGISPQHVPSSFAVKKEINKLKESLDDLIQEEFEMYRIKALEPKSGELGSTVPFVNVSDTAYKGVKIRLLSKSYDDADFILKPYFENVTQFENKYESPLTVQKYKVNNGYEYEQDEALTDIQGWEIQINMSEYEYDNYKIPKKIILSDVDVSTVPIIKITFVESTQTQFEAKDKLRSIYAPYVIEFNSDHNPTPLTETEFTTAKTGNLLGNYKDKKHSRIDITSKCFTGAFYPLPNEDVFFHNQEFINLSNTFARGYELVETVPTAKFYEMPNVNLSDTYQCVSINIHDGIQTLTLSINDKSIGYSTLIESSTISGFTKSFVNDDNSKIEIPKDCKISYRIEHLHKYDSDSSNPTSKCVKSECFESNYFDAVWPNNSHKIHYPTDRFRMISENEYFMNEFYGLKNTLTYDILEQKASESFDKLGHLNVQSSSTNDSFFVFSPINTGFELHRPTVYLTNLLKSSDGFKYLYNDLLVDKVVDTSGYKIYPEVQQNTIQSGEFYFVGGNASSSDDAIVSELDIESHTVIPSSFSSTSAVRLIKQADTYNSEDPEPTHGFGYRLSTTMTNISFDPVNPDTNYYLCPKVLYCSELNEFYDFTTIHDVQTANHNLLLTCSTPTLTSSSIFTLKPISELDTYVSGDLYVVYSSAGELALTGSINNSKLKEELEKIKSNGVQYLYVKSKTDYYGATETVYPTLDATNEKILLYVEDDNAKFNNVVLSEKINNRVICLMNSKTLSSDTSISMMVYYPDLRSFNHVERCENSSGTEHDCTFNVSLIVNHDILQLVNPISTLAIGQMNEKTQFEYIYLTRNSLMELLDFVNNVSYEDTTDPEHPTTVYVKPFDITQFLISGGKVYVPKGYKSVEKLKTILSLTDSDIEEFDELKMF